MIIGGEEKEDVCLICVDCSVVCQVILVVVRICVVVNCMVFIQDVCDVFYEVFRSDGIVLEWCVCLVEMVEVMQMFCMGVDGEMFNCEGMFWFEVDFIVVDFVIYVCEGYVVQFGIVYILLLNIVNNIVECD